LPVVLLQVNYFKGVDWPIQAYRANLFFPGGGGDVDGRGCGRGRSGGEGDCPAKLRPTSGVERGLHGFGQGQKQEPYHIGYSGVVFGGNPARLAVELGGDGDGDVSDGSHGPASSRISLYW